MYAAFRKELATQFKKYRRSLKRMLLNTKRSLFARGDRARRNSRYFRAQQRAAGHRRFHLGRAASLPVATGTRGDPETGNGGLTPGSKFELKLLKTSSVVRPARDLSSVKKAAANTTNINSEQAEPMIKSDNVVAS